MKVLWIVNSLFPEAQRLLTGKSNARGGGGWLYSMAQGIVDTGGIELSVATSSEEVNALTELKGEQIRYFIFPYFPKNYKRYLPYMRELKERVMPDVINIHGTELPYGLAFVESCGGDKVVVTIQGIISEIAKYYRAGLTRKEILCNITFRDCLRKSILGEQKEFIERGEKEINLLRRVNHVIGRTDFDHAHVMAINEKISYYSCGEILRPVFYSGKWTLERCERHSLFVSQAQYPVKGVHILFKALPMLLRKYPDLRLYIAGEDITSVHGLSQKMRRHGYSKILTHYIEQYHIKNYITFTGPLSAEEMKDRLLKTNVFVCPSSIENSSNSLCEAQILGVPSIASYVGGLPTLADRLSNSLLYRYDDCEMLAFYIDKLFRESPMLNDEELRTVHQRHSVSQIVRQMMFIYQKVNN